MSGQTTVDNQLVEINGGSPGGSGEFVWSILSG